MNTQNYLNQNRNGTKQKELQKNPQFRSKEAQDLMDSLNKIKQMIKTPEIKQLSQQTPTKSTTNSLQNSQVIPGSASPYQDLQVLTDFESQTITPQFQLPQPNLQKAMQYFPPSRKIKPSLIILSAIEEQNEEEYDTPIANKLKRPASNTQIGFIQEFTSQFGSSYFQSSQSTQRIHSDENVNIYRVKEEKRLKADKVEKLFKEDRFIKEDRPLFDDELNMQHQELKNLQLTLVKRIDSLTRNMSSKPLKQYIEKENEKQWANKTHQKKALSAQIQSESNETTPKSKLIQWTGIPNLSNRRESLGERLSKTRQQKQSHIQQYGGVSVVLVDLKFEKKPKTQPKRFSLK